MSWRVGYRAAFRGLLLALTVWVVGCVTPTLPPDEPPAPEVELGVGIARLRGHVGAGPAFVFVHNRVNDLVFGERTPTGAYDFEVRTEPCDVLVLWYTMGNFQSPGFAFRPADLVGPTGTCSGEGPVPEAADGGTEP